MRERPADHCLLSLPGSDALLVGERYWHPEERDTGTPEHLAYVRLYNAGRALSDLALAERFAILGVRTDDEYDAVLNQLHEQASRAPVCDATGRVSL